MELVLVANNTVGFVVFGSLDSGSFVLGSFDWLLADCIEPEIADCIVQRIVDYIEPEIVGCTVQKIADCIEPEPVGYIAQRIADYTELVVGCYAVLDFACTKLCNDKLAALLAQPIEFVPLLMLLRPEHKLVRMCMLRKRACKTMHKLMMCKLERIRIRIHKEIHTRHKHHTLRLLRSQHLAHNNDQNRNIVLAHSNDWRLHSKQPNESNE